MYLLNNETTLEWELLATSSAPTLGDLDLIFIDPNGLQTYMSAPILSENYTPPTSAANGVITYKFTPQLEGFWRIRLVTGSENSYQILSKMEMYVFDNTTITSPFSEEIGKPVPYDICYYLQGFVVPGEIYGSYTASRSISLAKDLPGSVAVCETVGLFFATDFDILQNNAVIGKIHFPRNSLVGQITCNPVLLAVGDKLKIRVTSQIDENISDISITLVGCCTVVPCSVF